MGQVRDLAQRISHARKVLYDVVQTARHSIYQLAIPINGAAVEQLLKPTSSVPTVVRHAVPISSDSAFSYHLNCRMLSRNVLARASMWTECL